MFDGLPSTYETKPDVFSLEGLIAWLETQDPATEYQFTNPMTCLATHYVQSIGGRLSGWGEPAKRYYGPNGQVVCDEYEHPVLQVARGLPGTYGAVLERAKALLASR